MTPMVPTRLPPIDRATCIFRGVDTVSPWHFISRQLARPSGLFGRLVMGRLLDRANANANGLVYESLAHDAHSRVLEVGFGGGSLLFRIAGSLDCGHIDGVEVSREMLAEAARRSRKLGLDRTLALHFGSADSLPFADSSFDCACSVHSIYFWPDLQRGLDELARVVKPGGRLVLGFGAAANMRAEGYAERGFNLYANEEIASACERSGFATERFAETGRKPQGTFYAYCGVRS